ncbi:hypothetical protein HQQ82_03435 [Rathayibacter sp. VKM Ac-2856]|uniref:hypothetical protein n=1 Tax=unclassified Rathayibacter TaxID=2609250 RepID=UPI0015669369|nr:MULTISPECIES: hypothetical protein [unclassified Rathayibacter]NQX03847.1 hypothetical protein [Rathayibacter sp. VKM Ac-2858]NQX19015.1 hypothetical protein [Rathayibacter sp. VKM Ac-2856]
MTPVSSPHRLAPGLVALVATGLLLGATPARAQGGHGPATSVTSITAGSLHSAGPSVPDFLTRGRQLVAGQYIQSEGPGATYTFRMQDDGNAVTYDEVGHAVFSTGTSGRGNRIVAQDDGNVVVYSDQSRPLWSTGTDIEPRATLIIQNDGNLVLYRQDDSPAWASDINDRIAQPPSSTLEYYNAVTRGHRLTSPSGLFRAEMQRDGNLVGYGPNGVLWSTGTRGVDNTLQISSDGELVIHDENDTEVWIADSEAVADSATLEDNGVLTVRDVNDRPLWDSQTALPGSALYSPNLLSADGLLRSDDGRYRVVMQGDGNVVVYGPAGAVWSSGTSGTGSSLRFGKDGVLQIVAGDGAVTWTAVPAAGGVGPFHLVMQSDGNIVAYDLHDRAVWSSR